VNTYLWLKRCSPEKTLSDFDGRGCLMGEMQSKFRMNAWLKTNGILGRLDGLSPWAFTVTLYLARWVIIIPIGYVLRQLGASDGKMTFDASAIVFFVGAVILSPLAETALECVVPYWLMLKVGGISVGKRPWWFVAVSAMIMALLHLGAWPSAILPSLVTGSFLAYTYGHFVVRGWRPAALHTCVFHAGINIVGWVLLVIF
jgi:hypothetical protein